MVTNEGPGGRCVPVVINMGVDPMDPEGGSGGQGPDPGYYPIGIWDIEPWAGLAFQQEQAHYFRYNFISVNATTGYGQCQFTSQAFADLDADGVYSTYERTGAADINGVNGAAGMFVDRDIE